MKRVFFLVLSCIFVGSLWANSSLEFNGQSNYVELSQLFNLGSSSLTVEAWVKIPVIGEGNLVSNERVGILFGNYGVGDENINFEVYSSGQTRYYWGGGEINEYGSKDLRDGAWHHLAFVRDKVNNKKLIYVDGVIDHESVGVGTDMNISALHRIGNDNRSSGNPFFHGTIDEFRVWDTARSREEIRKYMCLDVSSESNLLAYYQMSNDSGTSLSDNSTNSHTGTLVNMTNSGWVDDNQVLPGAGTEIDPYKVNGLNQLYSLSQNTSSWGSYFEQKIDILANATRYWDSGAGFSTIGTYENRFSGYFDGGNYNIDSLYINRASSRNIGLFGQIHNEGEIVNLTIRNAEIRGDYSVGILAGYGENIKISNCSSSGAIIGGNSVGGLIGQIANGTVDNSFSSGDVMGTSNVGGFIGSHGATIDNCYSRGSVNGQTYVGGFVGKASMMSHIDKCYASGQVIGNSYVGGFSGYTSPDVWEEGEFIALGAEILNSLWDTQTSNQLNGDSGTGKTTAEMKTVSTFTSEGWDFEAESANGDENIWDLDVTGVYNNGYPFLSWQNGPETALPIELISFTVTQSHGGVLLTWVTGCETENAGYIVERKAAFGEWEKLADFRTCASLEGSGTSSETHEYKYLDQNILSGSYKYRISDVDYQGEITVHQAVEIIVSEETFDKPKDFGLTAAYPNPFNPTLSLEYNISEDAQIEVAIFDLNGKRISTLESGFKSVGHYNLAWNAANVPSGIYVVKVVSGDKVDLQKVSLLK